MSGRFGDQGSGQQGAYDRQSGGYGAQRYGQGQQSSFGSPGMHSGGYGSQGGFGSQGGYDPATYGAQGSYGQQGSEQWPQSSWGQQNRQQRRGPKGYKRSDERIKEDLSERLMHSAHLDASEVTVEVKDGKVTLEGTVPERRMKHMIEDMAEACSGVNDVENKLRVSQFGSDTGSSGSSSDTSGSSSSTSGKTK
jgi:osmotically-inducible protein OsmY